MPALAHTLANVYLNQEQDEGPEEEVDNLHDQIEQVILKDPGIWVDVLAFSLRAVSDLRDEFDGGVRVK